MKKETVIRIFCSLLILLFTYAAVSKLANQPAFTTQLQTFPVIGSYASLFSWLIPLAELIVVCFLFFPSTGLYGLYGSLGLLLVFTGFLITMLVFDKHLPCSCGGIIAKLSWKGHIVFNLFFVIISFMGIYLCRKMDEQQLADTDRA